jgi:hypothetical protein
VSRPTEHIELEVPRLGEFARQLADVDSRDVHRCLLEQKRSGQRLGATMLQLGIIDRRQLYLLLKEQAKWAARMRSRDVAPLSFPLATPLSMCLPCFNEQDVIEDVLLGALAVLPEFAEEFEIVVVDDGSSDLTSSVVAGVAKQDDRVRLIRHPVNRGYGAAVSTALRAAQGDWICFTDGDGQFSFLDLPQLLCNAQSADVVIGYRRRRADNGVRRFNSNSWKWLIRCLMGLRVKDLDCAFKLFPRWVIDELKFSSEGACISAEIMAQCNRGGITICEAPVNHYPRAAGKATGANLRVVMKAFKELPIVWQYRKMSPWNLQRREIMHALPATDASRKSRLNGVELTASEREPFNDDRDNSHVVSATASNGEA